MNSKILVFGMVLLVCSMIFGTPALAQYDEGLDNEYHKAKVIEVLNQGERDYLGYPERYQNLKFQFIEGPEEGTEMLSEYLLPSPGHPDQFLKVGQTIIVLKSSLDEPPYTIIEQYRSPASLILIVIFLIIVIAFTRLAGLRAILTLAASLYIIGGFLVPQIATGANTLVIVAVSVTIILVISIFGTHGIKKRSTIAFFSSLVAVGLAIGLSFLFVDVAELFGVGTHESFLLQVGNLSFINLRGLLLAGIIISTIGILDDVTMVQVATVEEIHGADPTLSKKELIKRASSVGREHILSMVNTLVLVYTGAAIPVLLVFGYQTNVSLPLWVVLNSEVIVEELVRSLVGSTVLVFAVPITTYIAATMYTKDKKEETSNAEKAPTI